MLETFSWCPEVGAEATYTQRNLVAQFGDGYQQITGDGINTEKDVWPLTFNVDMTVGVAIRDFWRRHKERNPCYWTPPGETVAGKYLVKAFTMTFPGGNAAVVKLTLEKTYRLIG